MLCIAETGSWLVEPNIVRIITPKSPKRPERRLSIIVADRAYEDTLRNTYESKGIAIEIRDLPWWLHNQHMTVITSDGDPVRALYFERRHRGLTISPFGLDDAGDLKIVLDNYLAYWTKAKKHMANRDNFLVYPQDIDDARRELLS